MLNKFSGISVSDIQYRNVLSKFVTCGQLLNKFTGNSFNPVHSENVPLKLVICGQLLNKSSGISVSFPQYSNVPINPYSGSIFIKLFSDGLAIFLKLVQ